MYYGYYRNLRNNAWKCLIDFNIRTLPVDILGIARATGIHVVKNSSVDALESNEHGKSYFNGEEWIIVYDDRDNTARARFTIAHELGHILLGHDLICTEESDVKQFNIKTRSERQADSFAIRLLCPACVLNGLNVSSKEELAEYCKVPRSRAAKRYKRLCELRERNKFFTSKDEVRLYESFKPFIEETNARKQKSE